MFRSAPELNCTKQFSEVLPFFVLIWKAFQNTEEWRFSFWNIFFCYRDIDIFLLCKFMHFVSFVMHIDDAKFQEHCFNISRDIVYSVFPLFSCKPYDVITDLICIIEKCQYLFYEKRYFKKKNAILLYFERPFR